MSPAFWPLVLTGNKLAKTSPKLLLKWNLLHQICLCRFTLRASRTIATSVAKLVAPKMVFSSTRPSTTGILNFLSTNDTKLTDTLTGMSLTPIRALWCQCCQVSEFHLFHKQSLTDRCFRRSFNQTISHFSPWTPHCKPPSQHPLQLNKTEKNFCQLIHTFFRLHCWELRDH